MKEGVSGVLYFQIKG